MKKVLLINLLLALCLIPLLMSSCSSKNNTSDFASEQIDTTIDSIVEETEEQIPEDNPEEYIELNEDGVAPLDGKYSENCFSYDRGFDQVVNGELELPDRDDLAKWFHIYTKKADERIIKLRQSDTVGIYSDEEKITFIPITSSPQYTLPLNFADSNGDIDKVNKQPEEFGNFSGNYAAGAEIVEVNGEDISKYVNNNCYDFQTNDEYLKCFKLLTCNKDEKLIFGYYIGTKWVETTVQASIEYYKAYYGNSIEIIPEKTKKGYFTVDITSLKKGLYFVKNYKQFIEIV